MLGSETHPETNALEREIELLREMLEETRADRDSWWSSAMFRKTEETHGQQETEARRDCHEVTAG
jgi:hypothetical protein